jgi:L-threonylcarbamoyladenylate synthase
MGGTSDSFDACIASGGVALFPADTVYGLACDPEDPAAIERLYALKRRVPEKAAAVMFFGLPAALGALPELGPRTREALTRLLPGGVTLLVANPDRRFPLTCRADPDTLGVRVVDVPELRKARRAVLQSSANRSGEPPPRRLVDVIPEIRQLVELTVDGGELPGVASTVVDLRHYESEGHWRVVREGAVGTADLSAALVSSSRR